jgi:16S rRNA (uracil1498-N3)-methyltransferase
VPQFLVDPADVDETKGIALLRSDEARHLLKSLRARIGDEVLLFDGAGRRWGSRLKGADAAFAELDQLSALPSGEPPCEVHLINGLMKGQRWQWLLEKAVELGATRITPVITRYTVARPDEKRASDQRDRWQATALGAAKQCERAVVPLIDAPVEFEKFLAGLSPKAKGEARLACIERADGSGDPHLAGAATVRIAVGPEGGWSSEEAEALAASGFVPLSLGPRILRGETAAIVALAFVLKG